MLLEDYFKMMRPRIEHHLEKSLDAIPAEHSELRSMLAYHMGWEGDGAGLEAQGKRIRPMLVLLATEAVGGEWEKALPAAAAVELLHNFSLIHDDIQDNSPLRRGRDTVWVKWGIPQAINAGDLMFTLAHLSMLELSKQSPVQVTRNCAELLHRTCVQLTVGQYLDISYEKHNKLPVESYYPMISGKTAALLSCCMELGCLIASAADPILTGLSAFGRYLGLAFQVQDDWLGIWGDAALMGKSTDSDLVTGKKSLPVLYALNHDAGFADRWQQGPIGEDEVKCIVDRLSANGTEKYILDEAERLTRLAINSLENSGAGGDARQALQSLALRLLNREK